MKRVVIAAASAATLVQFTAQELTALQTLGCEVHLACPLEKPYISQEAMHLLEERFPQLVWHDIAFTDSLHAFRRNRKAGQELEQLLEGRPRVLALHVDLNRIDYDVDVLVIGGGGSGSSAAIEAHETGAKVMIVTKLRIGDANTMMAEGGIQAADKPGDSPAQHYLDVMGGGHYANRPELVRKLVMEGPEAIQWLNRLGVEFDKAPDGTMITTHGGGTSRKRMHAAKDYSGAEIMRTLRDEVLNRGIPVVDFTAARDGTAKGKPHCGFADFESGIRLCGSGWVAAQG